MRFQLRDCLGLALAGGLTAAAPRAALAQIEVHISKATQTMDVTVDGAHYATWRVSTASSEYRTPSGTFRPRRLEKVWFSRKYDDAPMPHSIFFLGGYAIHGTNSVRALGRPVSHGCIRLAPGNAAALFNMVRERGMRSTRIRIT